MNKEAIEPLGENVLIKVVKQDKKTKGGIYLPDTAGVEKPQEGKVAAISGSNKVSVKKNQKVIFAKYSGTEIKIEGEEYLIIKNEDILAVIK